MTVKEFIDLLAARELNNAQSSFVNMQGEILENKIPLVISYLKDSLTKLYDTFFLREDCIFIHLIEGKTTYSIHPKYNIITDPDWDHYIFRDVERPYDGDLLKILAVENSDKERLHINDECDKNSVYIPYNNIIQVPEFKSGQELCITYQANHPKLTGELDQELEIPDTLLSALSYYTAYRLYSNINSDMAVKNSAKYYQQYQEVINDISLSGSLRNMYLEPISKFHMGGWV